MIAEASLKESEVCFISTKKENGWLGKKRNYGFYKIFSSQRLTLL